MGRPGLRPTAFLLVCGVLSAAYFVVPEHARGAIYIGTELAAATAVVLGVFLHRTARRVPWLLLAAGLVAFAAGDAIWFFDPAGSSFPSAADIAYVGAYPILVAGIVVLIRRTRPGAAGALFSAAVLATGSGIAFWSSVIDREHSVSLAAGLVAGSYPTFDVLLVASLLLLFGTKAFRLPSLWFLTVGFAGLLVSDTLYGIDLARQSYTDGSAVDVGWFVFFACVGAAALHPSMRRLEKVVDPKPAELAWPRLLLLSGATLAVPAALVFSDRDARDLLVFALGSSTMTVLIFARMWLLLKAQQRHLAARLRIETELRESRERYRLLVESTSDLIKMTHEGRIVYASPSHEATLGYGPDELVGSALFAWVHPDDLRSAKAMIERLEPGGPPGSAVIRLQKKSGDWIFAESTASLIEDDGRRLLLTTTRDVTERVLRKRLEEQLLQSQKMEAIGQLAGGIAHDFNNLLVAITGYSSLVLAEQLSEPVRHDVEEVLRAAEQAAALTRQLLAFSRRQALRPIELDLNATLEDVEELLRRLIGEAIEVVTSPAGDLWHVSADPVQIEQVIVNLAVNARDAMSDGGTLTIETANIELRPGMGAEPGPYVRLRVSDTGEGMDEETRSRAFEPFFTTKPIGQGTGLGLATVYGIVTQSRGAVAISSEVGEGTTIDVFLPRTTDRARRSAARPSSNGRVASALPAATR